MVYSGSLWEAGRCRVHSRGRVEIRLCPVSASAAERGLACFRSKLSSCETADATAEHRQKTEHTRRDKRKGKEPTESAHTLQGKTKKPSVLDVPFPFAPNELLRMHSISRMGPVASPLDPWPHFLAVRLTVVASPCIYNPLRHTTLPPFEAFRACCSTFYQLSPLRGLPATFVVALVRPDLQHALVTSISPPYLGRTGR